MAQSIVGTEVHSRPTYSSAGTDIEPTSPGPPVRSIRTMSGTGVSRWKDITHSTLSMCLTASLVRG